MNRNHKKGFTLIELLVVIAIIGILSSIVLANVTEARRRSIDTAITSNINNARAEAALYYEDNDSSYEYLCGSTGLGGLIAATEEAGSASVNCSYGADGEGWALEAALFDNSTYFCVDHNGFAGEVPESRVADEDDTDCSE